MHSRLRSVEEGGPPPWIPFGKKIVKGGVETDKNFKSLSVSKDSTDKETTEFEAQRQDAIAEAARLGGKKVFGGGNKQVSQQPREKIVTYDIQSFNYLIIYSLIYCINGTSHFYRNIFAIQFFCFNLYELQSDEPEEVFRTSIQQNFTSIFTPSDIK